MLTRCEYAEVREKFPDKAVATVEEARVSTKGHVAMLRPCSVRAMLISRI